jgi:hypothetical protein
MGAGASAAEIEEKVKPASVDDLKGFVDALPEDQAAKIRKALEELKTPRVPDGVANGADGAAAEATATPPAEAPAESAAEAPAESAAEAPAESAAAAPAESAAAPEAPAEAPAESSAEAPASEKPADAPAAAASSEFELTPDQVENVKKTFEAIDTDKSGAIDPKELATFMKAIGQECSEEDMKTVFSNLDVNADGKVTIDEYMNMVKAALKTK